jgi:hypothetical protein
MKQSVKVFLDLHAKKKWEWVDVVVFNLITQGCVLRTCSILIVIQLTQFSKIVEGVKNILIQSGRIMVFAILMFLVWVRRQVDAVSILKITPKDWRV